jgi:hypothetical protein
MQERLGNITSSSTGVAGYLRKLEMRVVECNVFAQKPMNVYDLNYGEGMRILLELAGEN